MSNLFFLKKLIKQAKINTNLKKKKKQINIKKHTENKQKKKHIKKTYKNIYKQKNKKKLNLQQMGKMRIKQMMKMLRKL
jgi:hypothetical protein